MVFAGDFECIIWCVISEDFECVLWCFISGDFECVLWCIISGDFECVLWCVISGDFESILQMSLIEILSVYGDRSSLEILDVYCNNSWMGHPWRLVLPSDCLRLPVGMSVFGSTDPYELPDWTSWPWKGACRLVFINTSQKRCIKGQPRPPAVKAVPCASFFGVVDF